MSKIQHGQLWCFLRQNDGDRWLCTLIPVNVFEALGGACFDRREDREDQEGGALPVCAGRQPEVAH